MAKNKRRSTPPPIVQKPVTLSWSSRAKRLLGVGLFVVLLGFVVLGLADPSGQNWAATLSPFLLVFGYALIGISLASRRSVETASSVPK